MTSPTIMARSGATASAPIALRDGELPGGAEARVPEHHEAEHVGLGRAEREVDRPGRPGEEPPRGVHPVGVARARAEGGDHGLVAGRDPGRRDGLARRVVVEVPADAPVGGGLGVPDDGDAGLRVLEVGAARHRARPAATTPPPPGGGVPGPVGGVGGDDSPRSLPSSRGTRTTTARATLRGYLWARTSLSRAAITPRTPSTAASNCAFVKGLRVSACTADRICW